jgi:AraC-like DNA-binding protein
MHDLHTRPLRGQSRRSGLPEAGRSRERSDWTPQCDPIRKWREGYARLLLNIDFKPLSEAPFRASVTSIFDDLRIMRTMLTPGVTFRDEELVRDGDTSLWLVIAQSPGLEFDHRGRNLRLGRGDATVMHVCETGSMGSSQSFGYIGVMIPPEIDARSACLGGAVMRRLPGRSEGLQLLRAYLCALEKGHLSTWREGRETIRQHIIDLIALAITPHGILGESDLSAVQATRRAALLEHIAAHFQDPELDVATVARSQGISPRYLHRLIETTGTSFTAHVAELRLQWAFALLTEARQGKRRIADIALEAGFSDISHFNRLFRARFGDTPSGVRVKVASRSSGLES